MTAIAAPRRDRLSFWRTVSLLRGAGGAPPSIAPVLLLATFVVTAPAVGVLLLRRAPSPSDLFFVIASVLIPSAAMVAVLFEVRRVAALAFLRTIPQPHAARWLVLLPTCGLGVFAALASLWVLPTLAAVALLGCWCWAASVGHRFAGRGGGILLLVAVPLAYVALLAAAVSFAAGGFALVAAVSTALGFVGCFSSPRDRFLALVATSSGRGQATPDALTAPISSDIGSRPRGSAKRIFQLALRANPRALGRIWWIAIAICGICLLALTVGSPMGGVPVSLGFQMAIATGLASANSRASREFLVTKPLSRWLLLRGTVVPWLLLGLFAPTVAVLEAATRTAAVRNVLLRVAVLQLALFWSSAAFAITEARKERRRKRWTSVVLFVIPAALVLTANVPWLRLPWTLPPFWLAGGLAVAGAYALRNRLAVPD